MYYIAGNICGNYMLRFVVKSKVCRFNVCGLQNTSQLLHLQNKILSTKCLRNSVKIANRKISFLANISCNTVFSHHLCIELLAFASLL